MQLAKQAAHGAPVNDPNADTRTFDDLPAARNLYELLGLLLMENRVTWSELLIQRPFNDGAITLTAPAARSFGIKYFPTPVELVLYLVDHFGLEAGYTTRRKLIEQRMRERG